MIEIEREDEHAVLEVTVSDRLHKDDYEKLVPVFDAFVENHGRVAVLLVMRDFHGWDLGASWEDCELWFHHLGDFRRIALVGDHAWQRIMSEFCRVLTTAPVKYFDLKELEDAREWSSGPSSSALTLDLNEDAGIAHVRISGKLDPADFERVTPLIDAFVERHGQIRICLDLHEFDGWDSLAALRDHLAFIIKHQRFASRIALVGDLRWIRAAAAVIGAVAHPQTRCFPAGHTEQAESWLLGAGE